MYKMPGSKEFFKSSVPVQSWDASHSCMLYWYECSQLHWLTHVCSSQKFCNILLFRNLSLHIYTYMSGIFGMFAYVVLPLAQGVMGSIWLCQVTYVTKSPNWGNMWRISAGGVDSLTTEYYPLSTCILTIQRSFEMAIYYLPRAPSGICTEAGAERNVWLPSELSLSN
jgi:hypothetical protein